MPPLIAILTCHAYKDRAQAQRDTWVKEVQGADVRFFLGRSDPIGYQPGADEVVLDVADSYIALIWKMRAMLRWAREHGYEHVFKCDDDVYVRPDRLLASDYAAHDYVGRLRGPSGGFPAPYASGLGYWLSRRAMDVLMNAPELTHRAEDRWTGNTLWKAGIRCRADYRYAVIASKKSAVSAWEGPRQGNDLIAACEFAPETMRQVHQDWLSKRSDPRLTIGRRKASGPLSNICILVKTFLRDGYLKRSIAGIQNNLPESKIIIVDDGIESRDKITWYAKLRHQGHTCLWLPYDSGFGEKANAAIPYFDRQYVLIASDDFDFSKPGVREGIEKLVTVLDHDSSISVASGRVSDRPYESLLEIGDDWVRSIPGYTEERQAGNIPYKLCDLTVNYSLIRTWIFKSEIHPEGISWDGGAVKIGGGEHGAFFYDLKRAGYQVAYVPGVSISELPNTPNWKYPEYDKMRARARQPGRACLVKRGIKRWQLLDGVWEETEPCVTA